MIKQIISTFFAANLLALLLAAAYVEANQDIGAGESWYCEYEDFFEIISAIEATGEYPHFIEENRQRYEQYQAMNPDIPMSTVIAYVNVDMDNDFYSDIKDVADPSDVRVLVNKNHALPANWEPDNFVNIGAGHMMREEAATHFTQMRDAMQENGLRVNVIITYRSYSAQRNTHGNAVSRWGSASADRNWARAGHSEHQTGLAVDILHKAFEESMHQARYQETREFAWLIENAHNYGFILRYPNEYKDFHGYVFEPWHWRYVGVETATMMYNMEIALYEEFYGRYLVPEVLERVREFIMEQQALDEAEKAAAEEAAAREAVEDVTIDIDDAPAPHTESILIVPAQENNTDAQEPKSTAISAQLMAGIISSGFVVVGFIIYAISRRKKRPSAH